MPDLEDGESIEMKSSGSKPYVLKNVGGVYSCSCPAWRNRSLAIEKRSCKRLRKLRGDEECACCQPAARSGLVSHQARPRRRLSFDNHRRALLPHASQQPRHRGMLARSSRTCPRKVSPEFEGFHPCA